MERWSLWKIISGISVLTLGLVLLQSSLEGDGFSCQTCEDMATRQHLRSRKALPETKFSGPLILDFLASKTESEMLEICLVEMKHQGELKLWHPESLAHGSLLHAMIH
jgi:hypothetical protein